LQACIEGSACTRKQPGWVALDGRLGFCLSLISLGRGERIDLDLDLEEDAMAEVPSWRVKGDWFDVCGCRVPS
jgi:hypothetical protein